jgi:putative sterol carrier protein
MTHARFRIDISGGPDGDSSSDWNFTDSSVEPVSADEREPDLTMTVSYKEFQRMQAGELDPSVAYMQGLLKSTGNTGVLIDLLARSNDNAFSGWFRQET